MQPAAVLFTENYAMRLSLGIVFILIHSFSPSLLAQFNGNFEIERHILGEENFFDWKSYQEPLPWRHQWYETRNGMRASTGSISLEQFYVDHEFRFEADVEPYFTFLYNQTQEQFYQENPIYQEVEFRFGKEFYFSIIGYPQFEKKYGDAGFAFAYGDPYGEGFVRFSQIRQDQLFNEKNVVDDKHSGEDRYLETPRYSRLEIQSHSNNLLFRLKMKQVEPSHFLSTLEQVNKFYEDQEQELILDWNYREDQILGFTWHREEEKREHQKGNVPLLSQSLQLEYLDLYYHLQFSDVEFLTVGTMISYFQNKIDAPTPTEQYFFRLDSRQIYGFWQDRISQSTQILYSLQGGDFRLQRKKEKEQEDNSELQLKAGVGLILVDKKRFRFFANSTWDLDTFEQRQWDGGNIMLQIYF